MALARRKKKEFYEITVPEGHNIVVTDKDNVRRYAEPGEKVKLSSTTLTNDPFLRQFAKDIPKEEKLDAYSRATPESLKKALETADLKTEGDKNELAMRAREHGLPTNELVFLEGPPRKVETKVETPKK